MKKKIKKQPKIWYHYEWIKNGGGRDKVIKVIDEKPKRGKTK